MPFENNFPFFNDDNDNLKQIKQNTPCSEEYWYSIRRCIKCKKFYTEAENQDPTIKCIYHPGKYYELTPFTKGVKAGWSCCKVNGISNLNEKDKGCKQTNKHIEDENFTKTMRLFPFDPNANRDEQLKQLLNEETLLITKQPSSPLLYPDMETLKDDPNFIAHNVTRADTLAGLSLKYNITKEKIKRINRLPNDLVYQREIIYIPKTANCKVEIPSNDKLSKPTKLSMFASKTGCVKEEASFYLDESEWDLDVAIKNWKEDMSWSSKKN